MCKKQKTKKNFKKQYHHKKKNIISNFKMLLRKVVWVIKKKTFERLVFRRFSELPHLRAPGKVEGCHLA